MSTIQIIAGVIAGIVGAAIWAAVAYFANVEIGYIAWGIGILVGLAVAATGQRGPLAGVAAVLITIISLLGGKYVVVELFVQSMLAETGEFGFELGDADAEYTEEDLQVYLAGRIAFQREEAGETVEWPDVDDEEESSAAYYPPDIWQEAGEQLNGMSIDEKVALRKDQLAEMEEFTELFAESMRTGGFLASFGLMDILFFGLAIASAWGIASREQE